MTEHETLAAALVAALADITIIEAKRTAKIEKKAGGHFSYDYADIADVVKLTRPKLAEHGIVALTPVHDHGNGLACTVTLLHEKGDRLDLGPFPFPHGRDAQATGSMVTYHRRYALVAALGIAAGDDDDGASATAATPADRKTAQRPEGDPVNGAKVKLAGYLGKKGAPGDPVEHAKKVWEEAALLVVDVDWDGATREWVTPDQFGTLLKEADEYLADLAAMEAVPS